jgi:hypothetical protein
MQETLTAGTRQTSGMIAAPDASWLAVALAEAVMEDGTFGRGGKRR